MRWESDTRRAREVYRLDGTVAGEAFTARLGNGLHRLGRDADNDVVVDGEGVSRHHCLLLVGPSGVEVVDQESKNGTFADGKRIDRASVGSGAVLRFGQVELILEALDPRDALLALELGPVETSDPGARGPAPFPSTVTAHGRWLELVGRFADLLASDPDGSGLEALGSPHGGLGATAVAIVWLAAGREPEMVAACGNPPVGRIREVAEAVEKRGAQERADPLFLSRADASVCFLPDGEAGGRALIVTGDFPERERCGELLATLLRVHGAARSPGVVRGTPEPGELDFPPGFVAGSSPAVSRLYERLRTAAASSLPVLVVGETGVGKEILARLVHRSSDRRERPLVAVNCAAIPRDLLEAELFGIGERVATGVARRPGKFRQADGGSLFLDEVGEMPAELQAKLLRVLQEGSLDPLGEKPLQVDVRVIAATNSKLEEKIEDGSFRRDLYYRLAGFVLEVPPLRERPEDVPSLVEHFLRHTSGELGKPVRGLTLGALQLLLAHRWPGNVRELEHLVSRLVHLSAPGQVIDTASLAEAGFTGDDTPYAEPPSEANAAAQAPGSGVSRLADLDLGRLEIAAIREALRRSGGRLAEAAAALGLSRFSLRRRLERHGLGTEND